MNFPSELKYTRDHEWVSVDKNTGLIGLTEYAIEHLGDIVHIELPEVDEEYDSGSSFGTVESTKTVSDCYMPISGKIIEINDDVLNNLEGLSEDPYDDGWLIKVEFGQNAEEELGKLMSVKEYSAFIEEQED